MSDYDPATLGCRIQRLGTLMRPEPGNPWEAEGVLNPATAWVDGTLHLYPRLVSQGNVSRVGHAIVQIEQDRPAGVQRMGVALEADRAWEHGSQHGGVEDPRITTIDAIGRHVMTYVAFGPLGPKPAVAVSDDGIQWTRLGPLQFGYVDALDTDLNLFPNKDVVYFPEPVPDPDGRESIAVLHRPMWDFSFTRPDEPAVPPAMVPDARPGIWISYVPLEEVLRDVSALCRPTGHRVVAGPEYDWEALKIGAGPPPLRTPDGWLVLHHGVTGTISGGAFKPQQSVRYVVGAMLLDAADPSAVIARTSDPILEPFTDDETAGTVANVVFPTAIERIEDRVIVFYGMADSRIGIAELLRDAPEPGRDSATAP